MRIPKLRCECGRETKYKKGITRITCTCGRTYRLYKREGANHILVIFGKQSQTKPWVFGGL